MPPKGSLCARSSHAAGQHGNPCMRYMWGHDLHSMAQRSSDGVGGRKQAPQSCSCLIAFVREAGAIPSQSAVARHTALHGTQIQHQPTVHLSQPCLHTWEAYILLHVKRPSGTQQQGTHRAAFSSQLPVNASSSCTQHVAVFSFFCLARSCWLRHSCPSSSSGHSQVCGQLIDVDLERSY